MSLGFGFLQCAEHALPRAGDAPSKDKAEQIFCYLAAELGPCIVLPATVFQLDIARVSEYFTGYISPMFFCFFFCEEAYMLVWSVEMLKAVGC